jgi:NAD(P)-dependent dehydrogenase (short-subunit alcohol dehydrogenase family)
MTRNLIVTGASSGIGQALAILAIHEGWDVLATVRTDRDRAALEQLDCRTGILDLRDDASIAGFAELAKEWCGGRLDALVNNAGVAFPGAVEDLDPGDIREQFAVNVFGQIRLTQRLLPALRQAQGRLLFVSSDRAQAAVPGYGAYVASKRALEGFAETLAAEMQPFGVGVTILELGSFESAIRGAIAARLAAAARATTHYGELIRELTAKLGSPPLHPPEEAARVALDLLAVAAPPLFTVFPRRSQVKLLRQRLHDLEREMAQFLKTEPD